LSEAAARASRSGRFASVLAIDRTNLVGLVNELEADGSIGRRRV
jgi:hypothetical protein